eukprot:COSAG05_NODE_13847_length_416_cov_1.299685_1_plen_33_part_01
MRIACKQNLEFSKLAIYGHNTLIRVRLYALCLP